MRTTLVGFLAFAFFGCGSGECQSGSCSDAGLVINELAGTGGDFVELFNASDTERDLTGWGLTDMESDGGVRYATSLRFASGTTIAPRGFFTVFLNGDCPTGLTPCVRGEFGIAQATGEVLTLLNASNDTVAQQLYPADGAPSGSSWSREWDGAPTFVAQPRTPGATNEK